MNVNPQDLLVLIGAKEVEINLLRTENAALKAEIAALKQPKDKEQPNGDQLP